MTNPVFNYSLLRPEETLRTFLKKQEVVPASFHYHANYEMNFVINGLGTRHIGNNTEEFEEDDLILLGPNIPHCWKNNDAQQHPYASLVIHWKDSFMGDGGNQVIEFENISKLLALSNKGIKFDKYIAKEIKKRQSKLLMLPPFEKLILLIQLLNDLSKAKEFQTINEPASPLNNKEHHLRIETVKRYVEEEYSEKITLAVVARLVSMSEGSFSRFFSQTTGKPFFSFLNEYRIKMACKLLTETDMNADEIGYSCGYESIQFFYRQFSKYVSTTPLLFRKKMKKNNG